MTIEANVLITNPTGLHARPAVKFAQMASDYTAEVRIRAGDSGKWVKATSTARIMKLKARANTMLYLRAEGDDAEAAVAALSDFVRRDFDEGPLAQTNEQEPREHIVASVGTKAPEGFTPYGAMVFRSQTVSQGIAIGTLFRPKLAKSLHVVEGSNEEARMSAAIAKALEQLRELSGLSSTDGVAREIVRFQIDLLEDSDFLSSVFNSIANGTTALQAWQEFMSRETSEYAAAEDEYFRGRQSDIQDLAQRVAGLLGASVQRLDKIPRGAILAIGELTPSQFIELDAKELGGVVMERGSPMGHTAMLARAHGLPLLINGSTSLEDLPLKCKAILAADSDEGWLIVEPDSATRAWYEAMYEKQQLARSLEHEYVARRSETKAGRQIKIYLNVDDPRDLKEIDPKICDGIGLTRTEFLFYGQSQLPDEEVQYQVYRQLVEWADGRPVTIRTLDAGGDKPIVGLTQEGEDNPFLGLRGLRLSLARPDVFRVQLRALARAAALGPVKVMVPMVTVASEFQTAKTLMREVVEELHKEGQEAELPEFGMMVEIPAAALSVDTFDADFMSIGTNDLVQYVMAAGRDSPDLTALQNPLHPAVIELIGRVVEHGHRDGVEVSVCGEMAARPDCIAALLGAGVRALSIPAAAVGRVKFSVASV